MSSAKSLVHIGGGARSKTKQTNVTKNEAASLGSVSRENLGSANLQKYRAKGCSTLRVSVHVRVHMRGE